MMNDLLTTRQVQDILKVDRITVYRMLSDGRLKGVKVGAQWRFPAQEIERLLGIRKAEPEQPETAGEEMIFPVHCVQTIQDLFSEVSQMSALVVDMDGEPLTQVSHPCAFCQAMLSSSSGRQACRESWRAFARLSAGGRRSPTCHAGLQYLAAPIRDDGAPVGWFLVGQFYLQAPEPTQQTAAIQSLAQQHSLPQETLLQAAASIPIIENVRQTQVEDWPLAAARAVESILRERTSFIKRLKQIASLTQLTSQEFVP
jgi:excisionase family DNA binding protein